MTVRIEVHTGNRIADLVADLAALRISVFRAFPYLYDGDMGYEQRYLENYANGPNAVVIGAFDGPRLIGAATAAPMEDHADAFSEPVKAHGLDPAEILYCGESVLLPAYRGQGIGHAFFDGREDHARKIGRDLVAFCAVVRPNEHRERPVDYTPLDGFWERRRYERVPGLMASFEWCDIGGEAETAKPMQFWLRRL